jgi:hypothetical protein
MVSSAMSVRLAAIVAFYSIILPSAAHAVGRERSSRLRAKSLVPDHPVSRRMVEPPYVGPAVAPPGLAVSESTKNSTGPMLAKAAPAPASAPHVLSQSAGGAASQVNADTSKEMRTNATYSKFQPQVFFLFMVYDKINNVEVWERFLSSGIGKGVNYQALVHCKTEAQCRVHIRSHLFEIIPSVPTAYCTDLVGGMNALLHAAVLRAGAVENPRDKFVFVSDSTLPVKPLVPMVQQLTSDENSDFCVFPRNEWAEVPQNMPGGVAVTHLAVKHHQWVVLSRKHAEQAVARSHMHQDLMTRFQLNMGYHNTGCLDEFWHFATLYPELVILEHPSTNIGLAGFNGGSLSNSNYEIQGKCDTFVHWVPRAEGRSNNMSYLAKALASDAGTIMAPATESRPASFSRLSGDALVSFRKSGFLFARKVDNGAIFSGCASIADAFDQLIFKDNPVDVLPGHEMPFTGQGDWLDNQRTIVTISSSHGSVRLRGTGSDMHATGGYCGNTIDIVFENGYRASATVSPNGQWLRWSNGAVWPRA